MADALSSCRRCPRLAQHLDAQRERFPQHHNAPVPAWGPQDAAIILVGLAPGALGANRTGRTFDGDASAEFLQAAMTQAGMFHDGHPVDALLTNTVRCLPPKNRPSAAETRTCSERWLRPELTGRSVVVALGRVAHEAVLRCVREPLRQHPFGHASKHHFDNTTLFDCYHPSPLNTRTGRLTQQDLIEVLVAARNFARNAPTG